jgi:single-stranded-DNA-specific exonuclease
MDVSRNSYEDTSYLFQRRESSGKPLKISARNKRWEFREPASPETVDALRRGAVVSTLLFHRNINTPEAATTFFEATYPNGRHDPFLMKGMAEASSRLIHALRAQEPIAVYGDFDTDGITSVTLLKQALTALGGVVLPYIPLREGEGYGLNKQAIQNLAERGARLLITVDCGISNVAEVAYARELGLDVIVTDHHTPPSQLPEALAVVNPKQEGCPYPYKQLVGVGIAFKLVHSLLKQRLSSPSPLRGRDMLELVALGTVADLGPLDGENRILVKAGLEALNMTQRPGIQALSSVAGVIPGQIDSMAIGYRLAPRLNAAGRMGDARDAYELLLTDNEETALELARKLEQANRQRQSLTEEIQEEAFRQAQETGKISNKIVLLDNEAYPAGVVGLVAARLVEAWGRPVIMTERGTDESRGSARSIAGFNIIAALTTCQDLFVRFGGHARAAGFTIKTDHLPELEHRLLAHAETHLTDDLLAPSLIIDATIPMSQLTWEFFDTLASFEPFGEGNVQPVLMSQQLLASDIRTVGSSGQHLKLRLSQNGGKPEEAIAFGLGHLAEPLRKHPWIDVAYTLETNVWNGDHSLQLNVKDFRRAGKMGEKGVDFPHSKML